MPSFKQATAIGRSWGTREVLLATNGQTGPYTESWLKPGRHALESRVKKVAIPNAGIYVSIL